MSTSKQSTYYLYGTAALVVVGLVIFAVNNSIEQNVPSPYDEFAQCLTNSGVTMYGAWWCPHCENQKDLFGSAFDQVTYMECSTASRTMNQTCRDAGIEGYPTWEFGDGSRASGEQTLESLAEASGCALPSE
ncbi:hypothetical protein EPN81_02770 [Patescibacteria group bacterium]|nr:MAG: hypothetical protein EPN81_02770 [Patescibacteria group bacterium]